MHSFLPQTSFIAIYTSHEPRSGRKAVAPLVRAERAHKTTTSAEGAALFTWERDYLFRRFNDRATLGLLSHSFLFVNADWMSRPNYANG